MYLINNYAVWINMRGNEGYLFSTIVVNLPGYPTRPENPGFLTFGGLGFLASKPGYPRVSNFYNLELKNAWNGRKFEPIAILYVLSYVRFHLLSTDANLIKLRDLDFRLFERSASFMVDWLCNWFAWFQLKTIKIKSFKPVNISVIKSSHICKDKQRFFFIFWKPETRPGTQVFFFKKPETRLSKTRPRSYIH